MPLQAPGHAWLASFVAGSLDCGTPQTFSWAAPTDRDRSGANNEGQRLQRTLAADGRRPELPQLRPGRNDSPSTNGVNFVQLSLSHPDTTQR